MTLFRQIAILFSIFIIMVISSVMYLNFKSANDFIQDQLYTTSQDTATSLGLSLSMVIPKDNDLSTMETMINAIFDRGYYESIILYDNNGKVLIENRNELKVKNVPSWFIKNIKLKVPTAKSQISSGWMPYGTIAVKLHSGIAYLQLWNIFKDILQTFAILVSITLLSLYILLKIILKSLKEVEKQAQAITNNDFIIQKRLPFTTEFRHVVIAMNKMVIKVKEIFEHEATLVKKYNSLLYKDQDTGMGNRKFFSLRLSSLLEQDNSKSSGTVIIFVLNNFAKTKEKVGYEKLQTFINSLAELFYSTTKNIEERVVTRLKDSEFSMILPDTDYHEAKKIIDIFLLETENLKKRILGDIEDFYIIGGATYYNEKDTQKDILSRADFALSVAKMKNEPFVEFHKTEKEEPLIKAGKQEWHRFLTEAINNNGIKLAFQSVKDINTSKIFHKEVYLRIADKNGNIYPARVFIPMVNSLNMSDTIDRKVIELAVNHANNNPIAINITTSFIKNSNNIYWLERLLKKYENKDISFEASSYTVLHNLNDFINFSKLIQKYNFKFGIDNFNITKHSLEYLQTIKPAYIKANKTFYLDMLDSDLNTSYESFHILTKSLEIALISTAVEDKDEVAKLKKMNISLFQGSFIEKSTFL